jgi:hypothetical protein
VCVTSAEEVAQLVASPLGTGATNPTNPFSSKHPAEPALEDIHPFAVRVVDALSERSARTPEKIARDSGLSVEQTTAILGLLNMSDLVSERATGWVRKTVAQSPSS